MRSFERAVPDFVQEKTMKKGLILLVALIIAIITFAGCSDKNKRTVATFDEIATADQVFVEADNASLTGTWVGDFETWVFKKNGTGEITENYGDDSAKFDYELTGDDTIIFHVGSPDDNQKATCKLSEQVLILDFEDGKYFELRRQK